MLRAHGAQKTKSGDLRRQVPSRRGSICRDARHQPAPRSPGSGVRQRRARPDALAHGEATPEVSTALRGAGPPAGLRAPPAPRLPPDVREEPSRSPRRRGKPGGWHCPRRESGLGRRRSGCSCSPGGRDRVPGGLWPGESPPGSPPGCRRPPTSLRCKVGTCGPLVGSAPRDAVRCPLLCVSPWSCPGVSSSVPGSTFVKKWTWALCPWPQFAAARGGPCLDGCRKELFGSVVIIPFGPVTFEPHTGADHRSEFQCK